MSGSQTYNFKLNPELTLSAGYNVLAVSLNSCFSELLCPSDRRITFSPVVKHAILNLAQSSTLSALVVVYHATIIHVLTRTNIYKILLTRYKNMMAKSIMPEGYLEAPLAYDAVWATALGIMFIYIICIRLDYFLNSNFT